MVLLAIFLTAGLGLATPYLMLSLQPAWLRYLPKPGNWMITFKVLMGFPMIATAVWLLSQAADQFGESGVFLEGLFLVCVAFAAWVFGQWIQTGTGNRAWSWTLIVLALGGGYFGILEAQLQWRAPQVAKPTETTPTNATLPRSTKEAIAWVRWSPESVARARAEGRPVLVDFTAKWCLTCRVNEATAIDVPAIREQLAALNVVALRGDYTREDPAITEELRRFQRAGVPLVLVYPKNPSLPPRVLPNTLTRGIVEEALQWAAQ
jgi:thiol:disulfide interchange protein DsbD